MILAYISILKGRRKVALVAVSIAGVVPALAALNRGLILGLGLAAAYLVRTDSGTAR